jgi:hypothetical protein
MSKRLFSYCIPIDDGAAPNPFWDVCTLAICKPVIRRTAKIGDWVVGTGSINAPSGDLSSKIVYAMEVTDVMTMAAYDDWTKKKCPNKIPDRFSKDPRRVLGDSIYDFSVTPPKQRSGVHDTGNISTDLGGENVLLSTNFYYFGKKAIDLPHYLKSIIHQTQGHKVNINAPYVEPFIDWLLSSGHSHNTILGAPDLLKEVFDDLKVNAETRSRCSAQDENTPIC